MGLAVLGISVICQSVEPNSFKIGFKCKVNITVNLKLNFFNINASYPMVFVKKGGSCDP